MSILFRHKNPLKSVEFNQRFADVIGSSILRGFYFEPGTDDLSINIVSGSDESSLLITKSGVRIEVEENLLDVTTLTENAYPTTRTDTVYAKYVHGNKEAIVEYIVVEGTSNGEPAYAESDDTHVLIGYILLTANATDLTDAVFKYPKRGATLQDVANEVIFKSAVTFDESIHLPEPTADTEGANKSYVDKSIKSDVNEGFPYGTVISNMYNASSGVFEGVTYRRKDNTIFMQSQLSDLDAEGRFTTITLSRFADDGVTELGAEEWKLTYNEFGKITSKVRV